MDILRAIALVSEEKINEAIRNGAFNNLPGSGKPLVCEDDSHIPPECRMAHKILKNAGYVETSDTQPMHLSKELSRSSPADHTAYKAQLRFTIAMQKVHHTRNESTIPGVELLLDSPYAHSLLARFSH